MLSSLLALSVVAPQNAQSGLSVLVTGATGRTGQVLYNYLKVDHRVGGVRALVHGSGSGSPEERMKAKQALNCSACDSTEGIFYGDVTVPSSLTAAFAGIDTVAIAVASGSGSNSTMQKEIEFNGVENQAKLLVSGASDVSTKQVVLCSAMGTGSPQPPHPGLKDIMFWKRKAAMRLHEIA